MASGITGTPSLAASPTAYAGANSQLSAAIQTIWSKEILFQAMPILRFEQFAVKKTELNVAPGLQINFMRYNNLGAASQLTEGIRMETAALTAAQFSITVAEQGYAVSVSELLLNASFDDVMGTAARLLGRNMAIYLDTSARNTLYMSTAKVFGYTGNGTNASGAYNPYANGTTTNTETGLTGQYYLTSGAVMDAATTLASKNVPRLGDSYVCFVHPMQSRKLRNDPQWIEVTKYASPGNFMLGEIGRHNDVVFIETTQVGSVNNGSANVFRALMIGDNAFGHAISLPVELRDAGILDFGREHGLAWYAIWGFGLITDQSVVTLSTN